MERTVRAAESSLLVLASIAAPDAASALLQAVATLVPDEREVGRMRLAGALHGVLAQRLVPREKGEGRRPLVEWIEATDPLRTAISAGAEPLQLKKAIDRAVKDGHAETFAQLG
jgi:Tfp pilus assembly pilus retraction ATPase PilT